MLWSQMLSLAKSDDVHQDCQMSFTPSAVSTTKSAAPYSLLHILFRRRSEMAMNTSMFLSFQRTVFSYACLSHDICYVGSTSGTEWDDSNIEFIRNAKAMSAAAEPLPIWKEDNIGDCQHAEERAPDWFGFCTWLEY